MRLVDADALKDDLNELRKSPWFNTNVNGLIETAEYKARNEALNIVEELIMDPAQTVDPKQNIIVISPELIKQLSEIVVDSFNKIPWSEALEAYKSRTHGYWLNKQKEGWNCSECGEWSRSTDNFCKGCGADMRGGRE